MLFNSITFLVFFALVFATYWGAMAQHVRRRNAFILLVSYVFYGWWDWRFLSLIFVSSLSDYLIGLQLAKASDGDNASAKKGWLALSLLINLGILGTFKYLNFFLDSLQNSLQALGLESGISGLHLDWVLPVGISFYTFQTLSYTLDIGRGQLKPTRDPIAFFAFVSFFPQLVAGPIEGAKDLLPQFSTTPQFDPAAVRSGFLLALWGLFKKVVIADRLALVVDSTYGMGGEMGSGTAALATLLFAFQLYLDFSAYSEMAIGLARMLGIRLSTNFKRPYLARTFGEFWSRWHISLSTWFRDYLYIPLGGNRRGTARTWLNIMLVFLVSGLWHGASWNFVIWGGLNGAFLLLLDPLVLRPLGRLAYVGRPLQAILVTVCWALSLVFFRAQGWTGAEQIYLSLASSGIDFELMGMSPSEARLLGGLLVGMMGVEILQESRPKAAEWLLSRGTLVRWLVYWALGMGIILGGSYGLNIADSKFIYFQF